MENPAPFPVPFPIRPSEQPKNGKKGCFIPFNVVDPIQRNEGVLLIPQISGTAMELKAMELCFAQTAERTDDKNMTEAKTDKNDKNVAEVAKATYYLLKDSRLVVTEIKNQYVAVGYVHLTDTGVIVIIELNETTRKMAFELGLTALSGNQTGNEQSGNYVAEVYLLPPDIIRLNRETLEMNDRQFNMLTSHINPNGPEYRFLYEKSHEEKTTCGAPVVYLPSALPTIEESILASVRKDKSIPESTSVEPRSVLLEMKKIAVGQLPCGTIDYCYAVNGKYCLCLSEDQKRVLGVYDEKFDKIDSETIIRLIVMNEEIVYARSLELIYDNWNAEPKEKSIDRSDLDKLIDSEYMRTVFPFSTYHRRAMHLFYHVMGKPVWKPSCYFLCGNNSTGKSTFLNYLALLSQKKFKFDGLNNVYYIGDVIIRIDHTQFSDKDCDIVFKTTFVPHPHLRDEKLADPAILSKLMIKK